MQNNDDDINVRSRDYDKNAVTPSGHEMQVPNLGSR